MSTQMRTFINMLSLNEAEDSVDPKTCLYHITSSSRLTSIQKNGLMINSRSNDSQSDSGSTYNMLYGCQPIYCQNYKKWINNSPLMDETFLQINPTGLNLLPDMPNIKQRFSVQDAEDNIKGLTKKEDYKLTVPIRGSNDLKIYTYKDLFLKPQKWIKFTGTAALAQNIPPSAITVHRQGADDTEFQKRISAIKPSKLLPLNATRSDFITAINATPDAAWQYLDHGYHGVNFRALFLHKVNQVKDNPNAPMSVIIKLYNILFCEQFAKKLKIGNMHHLISLVNDPNFP